MRKLNYLIIVMMIATGLFMTSCEKDQDIQKQQTGEISFALELIDNFDFKDDVPVPECIDATMDHVVFILGGTTYTSDVIWVDGMPKTKAIKLTAAETGTTSYMLTSFLVYDDQDILIKAAPAVNSIYWDLMVNQLNVEVLIEAFKKQEVIIDVLCFEPLVYQYFGFAWFGLNEVVIERQCWFGDICISDFGSYENSLYEQQEAGEIMMDMPLIMHIDVYKGTSADGGATIVYGSTPIRTFSNEGDFAFNGDTYDGFMGEGACLEVYWANDIDLTEYFKFELYGLLADGTGVSYQLVDIFEFTDGNCPDPGDDGVNDFVIGDCGDGDFLYPCWANLPTDELFKLVAASPSNLGTYLDITLSEITAGFDIADGTFGSWCSDKNNPINPGSPYWVKAASTLSPLPAEVLATGLTTSQKNQLNYLFNNLSGYSEFTGLVLPDFTGNTNAMKNHLQDAIWYILGDISDPGLQYATDAINYGSLYIPMENDFYSVLFYVPGDGKFQLQLMPVPCATVN